MKRKILIILAISIFVLVCSNLPMFHQKDKCPFELRNGEWIYIQDDEPNNDYSGLVEYEDKFWKVDNGVVDFNSIGLRYIENYNDGEWFYFDSGAINFGYNGLADTDAGTWVVKDGRVDFGYSGTYKWNDIQYQVEGGRVQ